MIAGIAYRSLAACVAVAAFATVASAADTTETTSAPTRRHIIDEARFEVSGSLGTKSDFESGVFLTPSLFFDPFGSEGRQGFDKAFHPRLFLSANLSVAGEADQLMGGFSWKFPLLGPTFVDLGVGGALTDASLKDGGDRGPGVGSHLLFHEYLTFGVNLDERWSLTTTIRHSSNADFASPNSGLTYGGIGVGRKF
ncbi:acyloxyacyl hydrolase [Martelella endophytica]|uniref:acyloxyacyl hydrolase n=1 Tax=Martelella endophytica TaxID=1486262 RepID=UPI000A5C28F8|nr:acyloxyacyl hydrolase [Martelella endophytica]